MSAPKNLAGQTFGRLTVLQIDPDKKRRSWVCRCRCGNEKSVAQKELLRGDTRSCGCLFSENLAERNKRDKVNHDKLDSGGKRAYSKWAYMWNRVRNPNQKSKCYEGITVSDRWKNFYLFYEDMGAPQVGWSLDRIDSSRGYSADNCRWVPLAKQAQNTSRNIIVKIDGIEACVSEHARRHGLNPDVVFDRVNKLGWDLERALRTPKREISRRVQGRTQQAHCSANEEPESN